MFAVLAMRLCVYMYVSLLAYSLKGFCDLSDCDTVLGIVQVCDTYVCEVVYFVHMD